MKKTFVVAISFMFSASLFAQSTYGGLSIEKFRFNNVQVKTVNSLTDDIDNSLIRTQATMDKSILIRQSLLTDLNVSTKFDNAKRYINEQKPKEKSVLLGIVLSALVPGAGEFYAKSYLKAAIFFGVELLSWGTFTYFTIKGDNKTEDFENFADNNWDVRQYAQWLKDQNFLGAGGINPEEPDPNVLRQQINECERQNFTHTLPEYGSQQYYELIGKYQNFVAGWRDARINGVWIITKNNFETAKTQMFNDYAYDRQKANDFYKYASTGVMVVILNHILSAADAAWTVSVYNKKIKMETGFEIKRYFSPFTGRFGNLPSFNMKVSF